MMEVIVIVLVAIGVWLLIVLLTPRRHQAEPFSSEVAGKLATPNSKYRKHTGKPYFHYDENQLLRDMGGSNVPKDPYAPRPDHRLVRAYVDCLDNCQRADPNKHLGNGNLFCAMRCNTLASTARFENLPGNYHNVYADKPNEARHSEEMELCEKACDGAPFELTCLKECGCAQDIKWRCAQNCVYSGIDQERCRRECALVEGVECHL
jgi:hypothetical protein